MRYRGRHRQVAHPAWRTRRLATVAALTASALLAPLALSGPAATHAGTGVPPVTVDPIHVNNDSLEHTITIVTQAINNCTAPSGLCTAAAETAWDAIAAAQACVNATASELGISQTAVAALAAVDLDCGELVRLLLGLAEFAVQVVNDCTIETTAECHTVFDAARLGMDRAQGCLSAVLDQTGVYFGGTDPGCASATAMLFREAEGVIAMLTGCLNGSDMFCQQAQEHAEFARDGLTGCVGDVLWVVPADVRPVPAGGPLPCYAVLDQVTVSINALLDQMPSVTTQITPTNEPEECSITVMAAMPGVESSDPTLATRYDADSFVPSCDEPESIHTVTNASTPGLAGTGLEEGPNCKENETYVIDKVKRDGKAIKWHVIQGNRNAKSIHWSVERTVTSELGYKITPGAEAEASVWIAKVKAQVTHEASARREWTHTVKVEADIPYNTEGHVVSLGFTKVVEGRLIREHDDCSTDTLFRRIRVPYKDFWDYYETPYDGG